MPRSRTQAGGGGVGRQVAQPLEVHAGGEPREHGRTMLGEPAGGGAPPGEAARSASSVDDRVAARAGDRALGRTGAARLDQLAAERAHDGVRDGRQAKGPVADERSGGRADQRVAREPGVELARVVVEREHEARGRERRLVRGVDDHASVGVLPCPRLAAPGQRPAPRAAPGHEAQAVRPGGRDDVLDHGRRDYSGGRLFDPGVRHRSLSRCTRADVVPHRSRRRADLARRGHGGRRHARRAGSAAPAPDRALTLVIDRGAKVAIRRAPASRTLAVAAWKTSFGSVRRLRVVERRGDWFAVESDVLGNGIVGWVPRTAAIRRPQAALQRRGGPLASGC